MQVSMRSLSFVFRTALLASACTALVGVARADDCDNAFTEAQKAEKLGKLVEALAAYKSCASAACGVNMSNACNKQSLAVAERIPTVVVVATEGGKTLPKVTVSMDGAKIAADGTAVSANPGAHSFVFVSADGRSKTVEAIVVEGKKAQEVVASFEPIASTAAPVSSKPGAPVADVPSTGSAQRTLGVVVAGGGVVLAGVGGILGLTAKSRYDDSNAGNCDAASNKCNADGLAQRESAVSLGRTATVLAVIGGVATLGGVVLWLTSPSRSTGSSSVGVSPTGLVVEGRF